MPMPNRLEPIPGCCGREIEVRSLVNNALQRTICGRKMVIQFFGRAVPIDRPDKVVVKIGHVRLNRS